MYKRQDKENRTGSVTYLGVFTSGGRQSNWIQNTINTDDLLSLIENKSASTVLQCIGNNDRLTLLLALLRTPMTVAAVSYTHLIEFLKDPLRVKINLLPILRQFNSFICPF